MTMLVRNAVILSSLALMLPIGGCASSGDEERKQTSRLVALECVVVADPVPTALTSTPIDHEPGGRLPVPIVRDGGVTPIDGGVTPIDGGVTPIDGGVTPIDGGVTPIDGGVIEPVDAGVIDGPPPPIEFCGCHDPLTGEPVPCVPMPYPVCPEEEAGVVVTNPIAVAYDSTTPPVAYYTCGDETCEDSDDPPVYVVTSEQFVAEFVTATQLNVFTVPAGASAVQSPNGRFLFPLLEWSEPFADSSRPVTFTYQGVPRTLYLDIQNDCLPAGDRCICYRC
jgi:hypothetical protein